MKNDKTRPFFLMLFCIFLLSLIFTAFDLPFGNANTSPYDIGFVLGATLGNLIKIFITLALCYFVYRKVRAVRK
ncbi:hypothetical protein [Labilibaculum antarcticum]|uniref:hypothetical protein n=1 Tax=Labilibaculum antarcticum TaxID=1717717 RepID=UPI0011AB43C2|nr:hypothetical protein [Labilibaculum antarcticum]